MVHPDAPGAFQAFVGCGYLLLCQSLVTVDDMTLLVGAKSYYRAGAGLESELVRASRFVKRVDILMGVPGSGDASLRKASPVATPRARRQQACAGL